jgi:adenosylcobyric acid synthase
VALPSLSNFTDFDALRSEASVTVRFCSRPEYMEGADVVILPGSKQSADDLLWMRNNGLANAVVELAKSGMTIGVCGGMQMLGQVIRDPENMESSQSVPGLGLLPIETTMRQEKVTVPVSGRLAIEALFGQAVGNISLHGYEIHVGETSYLEGAQPFARLERHPTNRAAVLGQRIEDGCISADSRIFGTYLHGLFDGDAFRHAFIDAARTFCHLAPATERNNWQAQRQASLDRLAETVRASLDMRSIFAWAGLSYTGHARPTPVEIR